MKTNDERYKERYKELMDWMSSYQSAKSDDNDHHVVKIRAYLKQLVEENDLLRTQKVDLQKDKNAWETQAQKTAEQYHKLEAAKKRHWRNCITLTNARADIDEEKGQTRWTWIG